MSSPHTRGSTTIQKEVYIMQKTINVQGQLLSRARKNQIKVTIFLMNGFQLRGTIVAFDQFVVVVMSENKQQIIYKHAISTIAPDQPIPLEVATTD